MQALGADLFNGSSANLSQFRTTTRATYPLLRNASAGSGNENMYLPYGDRDSYAVVNRQGVVRYQAYDLWPHGNRYHKDELRATVDSLVNVLVGVDDGAIGRTHLLSAVPNPFRDVTTLELTNPTAQPLVARVTVHDLAGRRIATLWDRFVTPGPLRLAWDGRAGDGSLAAPGVYVVRARIGETTLERRIVRLR